MSARARSTFASQPGRTRPTSSSTSFRSSSRPNITEGWSLVFRHVRSHDACHEHCSGEKREGSDPADDDRSERVYACEVNGLEFQKERKKETSSRPCSGYSEMEEKKEGLLLQAVAGLRTPFSVLAHLHGRIGFYFGIARVYEGERDREKLRQKEWDSATVSQCFFFCQGNKEGMGCWVGLANTLASFWAILSFFLTLPFSPERERE